MSNLQRANVVLLELLPVKNNPYLTFQSTLNLNITDIFYFFQFIGNRNGSFPYLIWIVTLAPEGEIKHRNIVNRDLLHQRKLDTLRHLVHVFHQSRPELDHALLRILSYFIANCHQGNIRHRC